MGPSRAIRSPGPWPSRSPTGHAGSWCATAAWSPMPSKLVRRSSSRAGSTASPCRRRGCSRSVRPSSRRRTRVEDRMIGEIGALAVVMAFVVSAYGTIVPLLGVGLKRGELVQSGLRAVYANALLLGVASAAFLHALLTRDFGNAYVASYSSRDLGFWYTLSAFWAGQAGSLLFWAA